MKADEYWISLLDKLSKQTITESERTELQERIASDHDFRIFAENHGVLISSLQSYGKRQKLHQFLDTVHADMDHADIKKETVKKTSRIRRYWPLLAAAASVSVIVVVSMLMLQSMQREQEQAYMELLGNVKQLDKSQKQILATIKENAKPAILPGKYSGTGFFISANGFLATSYHVVKGADSIYVENEKYGWKKVALVFSDPQKDIAILEMNDKSTLPSTLPFRINEEEALLGEEVYTLGFPREDIVFGEGSVSALSGYRQNPYAYQISVPVNPGNSGGPLFDGKGNLVGMISGLQTQTYGAAFAVKSSTLHSMLENFPSDSLQKKITLPVRNTLKNQSRVEQVKRWSEFVFVVRVYSN